MNGPVIDPTMSGLAAGLVEARGVSIGPASGELRASRNAAVRRVVESDAAGGDERRGAVRQLLRAGGFKPAGRNKPAQEYLLRTARQEGDLPEIFNVVDLLNAVSLQSGLPISLVAANRAGEDFTIRYGRPGERYVFNQAGQELDVDGLICLCADDQPIGSPVKDSLQGKVREEDDHILACIFAPQAAIKPEELSEWAQQLSEGFRCWCAAQQCLAWLVPEQW